MAVLCNCSCYYPHSTSGLGCVSLLLLLSLSIYIVLACTHWRVRVVIAFSTPAFGTLLLLSCRCVWSLDMLMPFRNDDPPMPIHNQLKTTCHNFPHTHKHTHTMATRAERAKARKLMQCVVCRKIQAGTYFSMYNFRKINVVDRRCKVLSQ